MQAAPHGVARTALFTAAVRALHSESPTPSFVDPYARYVPPSLKLNLFRRLLATEIGFEILRKVESTGDSGVHAGLVARTNFIDHSILSLVGNPHCVKQIVLLAAGMDTRAFRLPFPPGVTVYEVDYTEVLSHKDGVLRGAGAQIMCSARVVVGADLAVVRLHDVLPVSGFDVGTPSLFVAEGLMTYLDPPSAASLMEDIASLCKHPSHLVLDLHGRLPRQLETIFRKSWYPDPHQFLTSQVASET
eukprot:TRINITY_DN1930_c0_g1_i1.p1 TRINITY_DN1930_c0_g1~~TRINITY_DN1930_c0_g1_i1.p1  ORF type:complete len:264 (+),score=58.15 TRINITY_DN1930_c0_g1_i1:56-793(+)